MVPVNIKTGIDNEKCKELAKFMGFSDEALDDAVDQMKGLYDLFMKNDCVQVEINPFVETTKENYDSKVYCVDAKLGFDDFAAYRNKEVFSWKDPSMEDPREMKAEEVGLNYVGLDGNVGCMVNGAGLAMATMDIIKQYGGEPANFLDVGGGANAQQVEDAFKLITSDPKVRCILVNIFGGIMRCDVIATGIVNAAKNLDMKVPIVVRLQGNFVNEAKEIIASSDMKIMSNDSLDEAAQLASTMSKIMEVAQKGNVTVNFELPI